MPNKFVCCARYCAMQSMSKPVLYLSSLQIPCDRRQQAAAILRGSLSALGTWPSPQQLPIVYHDAYNVSFLGLENLHVFDSKKFKKVVSALEQKKMLSRKQVKPGLCIEHSCLSSAWFTQPPCENDISTQGPAASQYFCWVQPV